MLLVIDDVNLINNFVWNMNIQIFIYIKFKVMLFNYIDKLVFYFYIYK